MKATRFRLILSLFVIAVAFFGIGFSVGNRRAAISGHDEYVRAAEAMLRAQGDSDQTVRTQVDLIRAQKSNELGSDSLQYFAIWFPSMLVIINIAVTVIFELRKGRNDA
ncbi:MAG TPA: hypothetical protein VIS96_09190 [Terrimicrobiaceae bacterium]